MAESKPGIWADGSDQDSAVLHFFKPEPFVYMSKEFIGMPRNFLSMDAGINFLIFLPVGVFIASLKNKRGADALFSFVQTAAVVLVVSAGAEVSQFFIQTRYSSLGDVVFNVSGALAGWALWRMLLHKTRLSI